MKSWKTIDRKTSFELGKFLKVETHTVELPDGQKIFDWSWLVLPDYVNVVACTPSGEFLCFRQTKYAVNGVSLAPVGGYVDLGEDPADAAVRELLEETGYEAARWVNLGSYPVDGNRGGGTAHLFLAMDARKVREADSDDLEDQQLLLLSRDEVEHALSAGEFQVLGWTAAMAMGLHYLRQE